MIHFLTKRVKLRPDLIAFNNLLPYKWVINPKRSYQLLKKRSYKPSWENGLINCFGKGAYKLSRDRVLSTVRLKDPVNCDRKGSFQLSQERVL